MKELPTAEEFTINHLGRPDRGYIMSPISDIEEAMISFATMHVHNALETAYRNGMLKVISNEEYREDEDLVEEYECGCDTIVLHKASILNAYLDELIK